MKVKYLRLSKEERKKYRDEFYQTDEGKKVKKNLRQSLICNILCLLISIYLIYDAFFKSISLMNKIYGISLFVLCIIGLFVYRKVYVRRVNQYVTKKNKK